MGTEDILNELEASRDRFDEAIAILKKSTSLSGRRQTRSDRRRRPRNAAAKRRISEGMKKRWAERKKGEGKES